MLSLRIALRYLFGKKSHSAVNAIALVSVAGVAVATAAVVCVLSVFNGFQSVITERLDSLSPDLLVEPREGKTIAQGDSLAAAIGKVQGVEVATPVLTDNALGFYDGREMPVTLKGVVPAEYSRVSAIDSLLIGDSSPLSLSELGSPALISIGTAYKLSLFGLGEDLTIFAPKRLGRFNPANPAAAFVMDSVKVAGVFQSMQQSYDENTVITDIAIVRDLLLYDSDATAIELKVRDGTDVGQVLSDVQKAVGNDFTVKDRLMQQELNFRMVQIEKWMTFLLLFFILIIASFNIISTLSMLVIEKQDSMHTLSAIGMTKERTAAVFRWESVLVSLFGAALGILLGAALCLLQQRFGWITIAADGSGAESMAYPVRLLASDLFVTLLPIAFITLVCAVVAGSFAKSRMQN